MSLALQNLIYDSRPHRKWIVLLGSFQKTDKQQI